MTATVKAQAGYASIMVPLNLGSGAADRVKLAASLADRFGSRLIGIAAEDFILPYVGDGLASVDALLIEESKRAVSADLARAEAIFRKAAGDMKHLVWRSAIETPRNFVLDQARAADLVVLARQAHHDPVQGGMSLSPGDLVMSLGRPLLVVPPDVSYLSGKHILVAWKDTREARRAVRDALPLLARAESVTVLSIGPDAEDQGAEDVRDYLVLHGVAAKAVLQTDSAKHAVNELIDFATEHGSDLIVSGAYGHNRMREWMFGGMTRDLLQASPVCCLMSH
ncbi:universal stress protein [Bosea sp. 2KB_26]|uniref:universal stress protein n=1 Tax=Bosea sp. 2KB_26 TaxID=3237475 RepID=UPI000DE2E789